MPNIAIASTLKGFVLTPDKPSTIIVRLHGDVQKVSIHIKEFLVIIHENVCFYLQQTL